MIVPFCLKTKAHPLKISQNDSLTVRAKNMGAKSFVFLPKLRKITQKIVMPLAEKLAQILLILFCEIDLGGAATVYDSIRSLLKELTSLPGVSGHEKEVIKRIYQKARAYTDRIHVDNLGNISVHIPSKVPDAPKVVVFGHMDEIGMMVRMIEPDGFLRLERVGGIHPQVLPGMKLLVTTEDGAVFSGVVGVRAHHVASEEEKRRIPEIRELYLDIGASSREEVMAWGIDVGNLLTYAPDWIEYGTDRVSCKAIDNRVANVILLHLLERWTKDDWTGPDVYLVFGVQEEFNVRGVLPAIRRIDPDICIGLDITVVYDTPETRGMGTVVLGAGPAITYLHYNEGGTLAGQAHNEALNRLFCQSAKKIGIPIQREVVIGVITETAFMSYEGTKGYITGNLSIPTRYTHTPVELISLRDVDYAITLLDEAISSIKTVDCFRPLPLNEQTTGLC